MTTYYCKCGRQVKKSSNADNTGNRDTADCTGCPYLLPWGPFVWDEVQKAFTQDSKGQECRMSREIRYDTTYQGGAKDKNTMSIASLDLDFLDEVQAWIIDQYPHEILHAEFSRGSIRGTDYSQQGRYRMPIYCAANKKGMAAKAALIEHFFTPQGTRKGVTPAQEQRLVLDAIEKGKAREKENAMKKQNDRCPLQQECERTCKVIGHERDCDYYVNNRYCTEGIPDQDELLAEEEIRQEREREEQYLASLSDKPSDLVTYQNEYGTLFAVRNHKDAPALMCKAKEADSWTLSGVLAAVQGEAYTAAGLQEVLDEYARAHGWQKAAPELPEETSRPQPDEVYRSAKSGWLYKIGEIADGKQRSYRTMRRDPHGDAWQPANSSLYPNLANAQGEFDAWISREQLEPAAPTGDAAATTDGSAVPKPSQTAETSTALSESSEGANSCPSAEIAPQPQANTPPVAPTAPTSLSSFDYSGLDDQTVADLHLAEREVSTGKRLAEIGLRRMADGVAIAHDALCVTIATKCRNGKGAFSDSEKTFGRWCESVGLNRKAAERLLQVSKLFDNSTPREQKVLEELGPSLLYAAAKPSAPAELVLAVKDGDITTHKQYQDLLARYNAEKAAREQAEHEASLDRKEQEDANAAALRYKAECDRRAQDQQRLEGLVSTAQYERDTALRRATEAEKQRDGARDALQAAKLRGDKLKAENDVLKAHPIEAQVVDEEEINRRAQARADELTAPMREELEALRARHPADPEEAEQAVQDAYDSTIYTGRVIESAWRTLRPLLACMDEARREQALRQLSKTISQIQGEICQCL